MSSFSYSPVCLKFSFNMSSCAGSLEDAAVSGGIADTKIREADPSRIDRSGKGEGLGLRHRELPYSRVYAVIYMELLYMAADLSILEKFTPLKR